MSQPRTWLTVSLLMFLSSILMSCQGSAPPPEDTLGMGTAHPAVPAGGPDLSQFRWIDLSYAYDENTLYWPTSPSTFELEQLAYGETPAGFFYASNALSTPEHGGTHLDAPIHFAAERWTTDEIPLDRLSGPGVVINAATQAAADADYRLTRADVDAWEAEHGPVPAGAIVLLDTGWGKRWPDRKSYLGDDTLGDASNLHFPSYGADAAAFLIEKRQISVLGVDTASIDHGPSTDFIVHQIANGANIPGLENVANLDQLPPTGSWIIALPMKIAGGSGGPVRVVALLPPS